MDSRHKFLNAIGCLILILFFLWLPAISEAARTDKQFNVQWQHGRLSVIADGAPLQDVLAEVARQTGLEIRGIRSLKRRSHLQLTDLTLREGLGRILAQVNHAIVENSAGS